MHATDIVAYTYNADIYCPGCIHRMFGVGSDADKLTTEEVLERAADIQGIDYEDPYSYDSDDFPKVVFADQANDGDFDHCGNFADPRYEDVCEQHIAHDERGPDGCLRWRNVEDTDDFSGRVITWNDYSEGFSLTLERVYPATRDRDDNKDQWRYTFSDEQATPLDGPTNRVIFEGDDFATPPWNDGPSIVAGILGFLSLQPGDTDAEYFEHYTPRQLAWMEERAETLSLAAYDQFDEE